MHMKRPLIVFAAVLVSVLAVTVPAAASAAATVRPSADRVSQLIDQEQSRVGQAAGANGPARKPGAGRPLATEPTSCSTPVKGAFACLTVTRANKDASGVNGPSAALVPFPLWCDFTLMGTRTEVCEVAGLRLTTYQIVNGVRVPTGFLDMNVFKFSYSSVDLSTFAYQIGLASYVGEGPALAASVSGTARSTGSCTTRSSSFPTQPLSPFNTLRSGESFYDTTATAVGAVGTCQTTWDLVLTVPNHTPAAWSTSLDEIRCDNATGANLNRPVRVGCVVPWYPSAITYFQSEYPSLASHVSRAQASGLPGASFDAPLYRTTDQTIINTNRNLACGDAPSVTGRSCDEYPLASTYNGLAFGGSRRTFSGCNISAPTGVTGPTGASACMITASENSAQGAMHARFNYDVRLLDADPFRVLIG